MSRLIFRFVFTALMSIYSVLDVDNGLNGGIVGIFGLQDSDDVSAEHGKINVADDGECVRPAATTMDLAWALGFSKRAKYIPMASQLYYATMAQRLTGDALDSWEELNGMCPEASSNPYGVSTVSGFGHTLKLICEVEWIGILNCCPASEDVEDCEGSNETTRIVATWTDNKDYLLTVSCQPDGYKVWNLVSTKKFVEPALGAGILEHLKQLYFDPKNAVEISYESCKSDE